MSTERNTEILKNAWDLLGKGDLDGLEQLFADQMIFVLPGQNDVIHGRKNFRTALDNIGSALPPGFDIIDLRYFANENEVVNILEWKCEKLPDGSQSAILFKFNEKGQITQERWFIDTEQWKNSF